jgi:hypothetical protein
MHNKENNPNLHEEGSNQSSSIRIFSSPSKAASSRLAESGYDENNKHLLSGKIANHIAKIKSEFIDEKNIIKAFTEIQNKIEQEESIKVNNKQEKLQELKIQHARTLGNMRKELKKYKIDHPNKSLSITLALDEIESADSEIENFKPTNKIGNEQKWDTPVHMDGSKNDDNKIEIINLSPKTEQQEKTTTELLTTLIIAAIFATISYLYTADLMSFLAIKLGAPFILTIIIVTSMIILSYRLLTPETKNEIPLSEAKKIREKHWFLASVPGKIADFIENKPYETALYAVLSICSIFFLSSTIIGTNIVTKAALLLGVHYYPALYITIPILLAIAIGLVKSFETNPTEDKPKQQENFKPFKINPVARLWQAINMFLDKFYLMGLKSPIAMLIFTTAYTILTIDILTPFLPALAHNVVIYFLTGIANPSSGLLFAAICTGWLIGLVILQIADIITRGHNSATIATIEYIKDHPIDSVIFFLVLIFSASMIANTPMADICGRWLILGLVMINFKPLLAIGDFINSPRKSIIGSTIGSVLMPTKIILYPAELIKYIIKMALYIGFGMVKHFAIHVPLVLIRACFDMATILFIQLGAKDAAKKTIDINIDIYTETRIFIINVKHFGKQFIKNITPATEILGKICSGLLAVLCGALSYTGLHYIYYGALPSVASLPWISAPIKLLGASFGLPATMTIIAVFAAYFCILSAHQVLMKKEQYSGAEEKFTMGAQIITAVLIAICAALITLQPPFYAAFVIASIIMSFVGTMISSYKASETNANNMQINHNDPTPEKPNENSQEVLNPEATTYPQEKYGDKLRDNLQPPSIHGEIETAANYTKGPQLQGAVETSYQKNINALHHLSLQPNQPYKNLYFE